MTYSQATASRRVFDGSEGVARYVILWVRIFFAAHLLYSAGRYFLGIEGFGPGPNTLGGEFVTAITKIGLYHMVKVTELIIGIMLLFNVLVPLVLVVEFPITMMILLLNTFVVGTGRQLFTGPQELFLNGFLLLAYGRYYARMFTVFAPTRPLWTMTRGDIQSPQP
jgi:hypothetical protein